MITEKTDLSSASPATLVAERVGDSVSEPVRTIDEGVALENLASQIQADARNDALFYLVRSNTSYDGE